MLSHISSSALAIIALSITLLVPTSHALPYPNPSASPAPTTTVSAAAVPSPTAAAGNETAAAAAGITLAQLEKAYAPNCLATVPPGFPDAITCKDALPFINSAIKKYGLETAGEKAAYLATMAYEGAYLKYNHNLGDPSQGTRSIIPAVNLRRFVDANKSVQKFWPGYPNDVNNAGIVDVLIKNKADFEPGAWWVKSGPGCLPSANALPRTLPNDAESKKLFVAWETTCINGGEATVADRWTIVDPVESSGPIDRCG